MDLPLKLNLIFVFIVILRDVLGSKELNGKCGYPGKPYNTLLEPDNKVEYLEGEEVSYQCEDYWFQPQNRKCEKGKWVGKAARCAAWISNVRVKDVTIEDISVPEKPVKTLEYLNMSLIPSSWKIPNAFTETRFEPKLKAYGTKPHKWTFKFNVPVVKLFVKININFVNYTQLTNEQKLNFSFAIKMNVSPHRNCTMDFQNEEKWTDNGGKINSFFSCDSISEEGYQKDYENPGDYLIMETQSNVDLKHYMLAMLFGKNHGTHEEPLCGEPEVDISQTARISQRYSDYKIECKKDWKLIESESRLKCVTDMKWEGSYPVCLPIKTCSLDQLLTEQKTNQTIITSLNELYFYNETNYFAIEGTRVQYGCSQPNTDILVGKDESMCGKNGKWSSAEPYCYNQSQNTKIPILTIILIIVGVIVIIIILITVLFYINTKRIRNKVIQQIEIQKNTEGYDDIGNNYGYSDYSYEQNGGQNYGIDANYEDHYYDNTVNNYVGKESEDSQQNDEFRATKGFSSYMEMKSTPIPMPRISITNQ